MTRFKMLRSAPSLALAVYACLGCSSATEGHIETQSLAIVGGQADTEHDAVMMLLVAGDEGSGLCSGTVFHTDLEQGVGYFVTAAHCLQGLEPWVVLEGEDAAASHTSYRALDSVADERVLGTAAHDVAVVRIVGVDAETPVIPLVDPGSDFIAVGDTLTMVGYGQTLPNSGENTLRNTIDLEVIESTLETLSATGLGDTCSGDSGGPALVQVAGGERIAGVTSLGDRSCFLGTEIARIAPSYDEVIAPFLASPVPDTCTRCRGALNSGRGACVALINACREDADCDAIWNCTGGCFDEACALACVQGNGAEQYEETLACSCDPCAEQCAREEGGCSVLRRIEERRNAPEAGTESEPDGGDPNMSASPNRRRDDGGCAVAPARVRGGRGGLLLGMLAFLLGRRRRGRVR